MKRIHQKSISSTQDAARQAKAQLRPNEGLLFTADEQTAGRGTHGRSWASPAGVNLYATYSFLIPQEKSADLVHMPQVTALALATVLQQYDLSPTIKWVNDILIDHHKKICGVLCESETMLFDQQSYMAVYIGVGVNVNMTAKQCVGIDQAVTSMMLECGQVIDKEAVLTQLSAALIENIDQLLGQGFASLQPTVNALLETYGGQSIVFDPSDQGDPKAFIEGNITGIDDNGFLRLAVDGAVQSYRNGRIITRKNGADPD